MNCSVFQNWDLTGKTWDKFQTFTVWTCLIILNTLRLYYGCNELRPSMSRGANCFISQENWRYSSNSRRMKACDGLHACSVVVQQSLRRGEAEPWSQLTQTAALCLIGHSAKSSPTLCLCFYKRDEFIWTKLENELDSAPLATDL